MLSLVSLHRSHFDGCFSFIIQQQDLDPEVLRACADAMRSFALPCVVPDAKNCIDVVGTGGDGMDTFNVSSAAGIVLAACGLKVAKHGNRSASGSVGSADFCESSLIFVPTDTSSTVTLTFFFFTVDTVEALGANVMLDGEQVAGAIKECGFGFLFAQMFHPAMKNVSPVRKEMGVKTIVCLRAESHPHIHTCAHTQRDEKWKELHV
jgi:anthranilate phosphoribosyltransferase